MIRFDYKINNEGIVNVTVVEEGLNNTHSLCGRLVLSRSHWDWLWKACAIFDAPINLDHPEQHFKFENKGESK